MIFCRGLWEPGESQPAKSAKCTYEDWLLEATATCSSQSSSSRLQQHSSPHTGCSKVGCGAAGAGEEVFNEDGKGFGRKWLVAACLHPCSAHCKLEELRQTGGLA